MDTDSLISFSCRRCFARLQAHRDLVGTKRMCPRCYFVLAVPDRSEPLRQAGTYEVHEGQWTADPNAARYIPVTCHLCGTCVQAPEDQAGKEVRCPDCDSMVHVPQPRPEPLDKESAEPPPPVDIYPLCEEVDPSTAGVRPMQQSYFAVTCSRCATLIQVPEDEAGAEVQCPDCHLVMIAERPAEPPKRKGSSAFRTAPDEEYGLFDGTAQPPPDAETVYQEYIAVECSLCHTRLQATLDQVGQQLTCPDCGQSLVVPPQVVAKKKVDPMAGAGEGYHLDAATVTRPEYRPLDDPSHRPWQATSARTEMAQAEAARRRQLTVGKPPRWTFFSGVLQFPFYDDVWPRWLGLSAGAVVVLFVASVALSLGLTPNQGLASAPSWILSLVFTAIAFILAMIWLVSAAPQLLTVLRDTAAGADRAQSWPGPVFTDWAADAWLIFNSVATAGIVGLGLRWLAEKAEIASWPFLPGAIVFLFPFMLLSMLETNSSIKPVSLPVARSLLTRCWGWCLFYVETGLLAAAMIGCVIATARVAMWLTIAVAPALVVALLIIYFRLLGRLAWYCGPRERQDEASE